MGNVKNNQAYSGDSTSFTKCVLTFKGGKIYEGSSTSFTHEIGSIKGAEYVDEAYIAAFLHFFVSPVFSMR